MPARGRLIESAGGGGPFERDFGGAPRPTIAGRMPNREERVRQTSRSGRFRQPADPRAVSFTESVSFDRRLWRQDIVGSMAHARMLARTGVLSEGDRDRILEALQDIGDEIERGDFHWDPALEDVHMNIEAALTDRVPAGARLHAGRSRNDQVALDVRMWLREATLDTLRALSGLQRSLVGLARRSGRIAIPGYTHLQRAQPVPAAHHLLAYAEMLERDKGRLRDSFPRLNVCPLGSGGPGRHHPARRPGGGRPGAGLRRLRRRSQAEPQLHGRGGRPGLRGGVPLGGGP